MFAWGRPIWSIGRMFVVASVQLVERHPRVLQVGGVEAVSGDKHQRRSNSKRSALRPRRMKLGVWLKSFSWGLLALYFAVRPANICGNVPWQAVLRTLDPSGLNKLVLGLRRTYFG